MTERLKIIFSHLSDCEVFCDVGCDHGYIAKAMIKSGKAKKVIATDISAPSLDKAINLLSNEIEQGVALALVSDGLDKVEFSDLVLIAGMGGEEIVKIIQKAPFLPQKLVLQPMKNCDKVRKCVLENGYKFIKDFVFFTAGKYYDLIVLEKGEDHLSLDEIEFGRDNLAKENSAFNQLIKQKISKLKKYSLKTDLSSEVKAQMLENIKRLEKYVKD